MSKQKILLLSVLWIKAEGYERMAGYISEYEDSEVAFNVRSGNTGQQSKDVNELFIHVDLISIHTRFYVRSVKEMIICWHVDFTYTCEQH